jgi:hypothetical protein
MIPPAPKRTETKFTFRLLQVFDGLGPALTPEQRTDRVSKILAPQTLRTVKEERKQTGTGEQGDIDGGTSTTRLPGKSKA